MQKEHADARLPQSTADGLRQSALEQRLLEGQLRAFRAAREQKLPLQGFGVHADAHGGKLHGDVEQRVIDENIPVEGPIVVIGRAAVVRRAI